MKKIIFLNKNLVSELEINNNQDEIINCKLCQREIVIYSINKYPNVCFYDTLTSYNFCSYKCFTRRAETYQEWIETEEEDTD